MYHRKLQNQIDKLRLPPLRQPVRTHAVLLADSKCVNLQQQVKVNPESFIQFWCKSSATAENRLQYLQDNLGRELNTLHNITLYVWIFIILSNNLGIKLNLYFYNYQFIQYMSLMHIKVTKRKIHLKRMIIFLNNKLMLWIFTLMIPTDFCM